MAIALSEDSPALLTNLQPLWHRSAPRRVVKDCPTQDPLSGWATWQKHLAKRKRPLAPPFLTGRDAPLLWGWRKNWNRSEIAEAIQSPERIAEMVLASDTPAATSQEALQWVALAYALPDLATSLPAESWWQLIEILHDAAIAAQQHRVDAHSDAQDILRHELLAGELPLVLAYLFPEIRSLRALSKLADAALSDSLIELTDGQGLPQARLLPELSALFACWTRCRWIGERTKRDCWSEDADAQYQWLLRHALRLADETGHPMLTEREEPNARWPRRLFAMALELSGDRGDLAAAAAIFSKHVLPAKARSKTKDQPRPSLNSQWSGLSVLGSGWSKSDLRLAVAELGNRLRIELWNGREQFFAGEVISETRCDGQLVRPVAEWEQVCWHSNKHCDYLELSIELSAGVKLERQFVLGRADRVLYVADIVHAAGASQRINHSISLPLSPGIQWKPEQETCDGLLLGDKRRAAVLPLELSEWRSACRHGRLTADGNQLTLAQEAAGGALCSPLFIDFKTRRAEKDRTWRQLTVAESLATVAHDVAVGYRAQTGRDQWLFYRSLASPGNRTLLGHNISGEFSAGRFQKSGKLDEWLEIEAYQ